MVHRQKVLIGLLEKCPCQGYALFATQRVVRDNGGNEFVKPHLVPIVLSIS